MRRCSVLIALLLLTVPIFSFLPVSGLRYSMDKGLGSVDASYRGERSGSQAGTDVEIVGDVNGDGYEDLLIGAGFDSEGGSTAGQAYLIFGNSTGWAMDKSLSNADASFKGTSDSQLGTAVGGRGDVNGDGYDDLLIGALQSDSYAGKTFLFLGKPSGWTMDTSVSNANASFIGINADDKTGCKVAIIGDVNDDGFDDIGIGGFNFGGRAYIIFGKETGWSKDDSLSNANVSFSPEGGSDNAGFGISYIGDMNGDGIDDVMINADNNNGGVGKVYLFWGKKTWSSSVALSSADATFVGESVGDRLGRFADGAGDVNGDGLNDIIVGSYGNDQGASDAGQVYLIFGRQTGWGKGISVSNANASFIGEAAGDNAGYGVAGAGDVNGDGFNDVIIAAPMNNQMASDAGQVYLILGKASDWAMDQSLSTANASFLGEATNNYAGYLENGWGDLNGDGYDDIVIGANPNDEAYANAGQAYVIFPELNSKPSGITSVKVYSDPGYTNEVSVAHMNDTLFIDLTGTDGNASKVDRSVVMITSSVNCKGGILVDLTESGANTGKYRASFSIKDHLDLDMNWVRSSPWETVQVTSNQDKTKNASVLVLGDMTLAPIQDDLTAVEDELYLTTYSIKSGPDIVWTYASNASWLSWSGSNSTISGVPDNSDVGSFWVKINVTCHGASDEHNFTLTVENRPPTISSTDITVAIEKAPYANDYNSTDDGQGMITWHLWTNASSWLSINATSGVLSGTPANADVGSHKVNVSVDDGNGGLAWHNFTLTVNDVNDPPIITTLDDGTAYEDQPYGVIYQATDNDPGDAILWHLWTDTGAWLTLNPVTGVLAGTPDNADVGTYHVNVSVTDKVMARDYHNFTLTVINVNDPPEWTNVSSDATLAVGDRYQFDVNATDIDVGDKLAYSIKSTPSSSIGIDPDTGLIIWAVPTEGVFNINISVSDGNATIYHEFVITVFVPNFPPTSTLLAPANGDILMNMSVRLEWSGEDAEDEPLSFNVYLDKDMTRVETLSDLSLLLVGSNGTSVQTPLLEKEVVYFWTVIPRDTNAKGNCTSGVWSFTISKWVTPPNNPPHITGDADHAIVYIGDDLDYVFEGTDPDPGDANSLIWTVEMGPPGMTIDKGGVLHWVPEEKNVGNHTVVVRLSDGKDFVEDEFIVTVKSKDGGGGDHDGGMSTLNTVFPYIVLVIVIMVVLGIIIVMRGQREQQRKLAPPARREGSRYKDVDGEAPPVNHRSHEPTPVPHDDRIPEAVTMPIAETRTKEGPDFEEVTDRSEERSVEELEPVVVRGEAKKKEELSVKGSPTKPESITSEMIMDALTQLPRGLPSWFMGRDMEVIVDELMMAQYKKVEGEVHVKLGRDWYYGDPKRLGDYLQRVR